MMGEFAVDPFGSECCGSLAFCNLALACFGPLIQDIETTTLNRRSRGRVSLPVLAHKTRRLGRQAGPVVGVLLPHWPVGRDPALMTPFRLAAN
jgi:hypothetical protein